MKQGGGKEGTVNLYFQGLVHAEGNKNNCHGKSKRLLKIYFEGLCN